MTPKPTYAALQLALRDLETNQRYKRLSPKRKKLIARMAQVYANPDNSAPDVIVRAMRRKRREQTKAASARLATVFETTVTRGAAALAALGDMEWEMLHG